MLFDASSGGVAPRSPLPVGRDETNADKRKYRSEQEAQGAFRSA